MNLIAQLGAVPDEFVRPAIDWHALAPELTLLAVGVLLTLVDVVYLERGRAISPALAGLGLLAPIIPIITLALHENNERTLFFGSYVVDDYSLVLKAMFLLSAYVVVLLSTNSIAEGDYWESEYYSMIVASVLGMIMMASSRDLVSIFLALELLSIPAYMLAAWRKTSARSHEAGMKYYLMGVFASAVLLYGMSLLFGVTGSTLLSDIAVATSVDNPSPLLILAVVFVFVGFGFKVSAVPFHTWAPDTYEGAPTPVTAFLAVSSKAAGFVGLLNMVFIGFIGLDEVWEPLAWVLAVITMTVGNLIALRQTNVVRMLAYSGVAQAGFMLAPFAVGGGDNSKVAVEAVVVYLLIYAAMNLGAFAVVIAMARKTRSAELESFGGALNFAPGLTVAFSIFLFALAGIPPLGGWFAKFEVFRAVIGDGTAAGVVLGVVMAVNSVIALFYYARIASQMWFSEAPDGDNSAVPVPPALSSAVLICATLTVAFGVLPQLVGRFGDLASNIVAVAS